MTMISALGCSSACGVASAVACACAAPIVSAQRLAPAKAAKTCFLSLILLFPCDEARAAPFGTMPLVLPSEGSAYIGADMHIGLPSYFMMARIALTDPPHGWSFQHRPLAWPIAFSPALTVKKPNVMQRPQLHAFTTVKLMATKFPLHISKYLEICPRFRSGWRKPQGRSLSIITVTKRLPSGHAEHIDHRGFHI
jgi:hypothetical protein